MKRIDKIVFERMPSEPPKGWYELWSPHILSQYGVPEPRGPCDLHLGSLLEFPCKTCGEFMCEGHWGFIPLPDVTVTDQETGDVREFHVLNPLFEDKMTYVPVLPNADREVTLNEKFSMVDDTTLIYNDILNILEKWQLNKEVQYPIIIWEDIMRVLQFEVDLLFDNRDGIKDLRGRHIMGIIDKLKGKQGHLRRVCLGKRMNSSARTVFTVNPRLDIDEINVPQAIADVLTVDLPATDENAQDPGVFEVRDVRTNRYFRAELWIPNRMPNLDDDDREHYRLVRHLRDGDIVVHGRQPSLHRMSQLAHYVVIWPHKTLAINPACCKPLNADCDGDATWIWVPQSEGAKREAAEIMLASKNIVSPRTNKPIIGPEQDFRTQEYLETGENKEYYEPEEINELIHRESRTMLQHGITFDEGFMKVITSKAGSRGSPSQYKQMYEEGLKGRSSFTKGLNPAEFWDHAIEGRRSMMAKKLSVPATGYMQRKLIFCLGDMRVVKDGTVRDSQDRLISNVDFRDKFPVGTFVGIIAAQSLGEASTQTMLRAFHKPGEIDTGSFDHLNWLLTSYTNFEKSELLEEVIGFFEKQGQPFDRDLLEFVVDAKFVDGEEYGLGWGYVLKHKDPLHAMGFERIRQTLKSLPGRVDTLNSPFSQVIVGSYKQWLNED